LTLTLTLEARFGVTNTSLLACLSNVKGKEEARKGKRAERPLHLRHC